MFIYLFIDYILTSIFEFMRRIQRTKSQYP